MPKINPLKPDSIQKLSPLEAYALTTDENTPLYTAPTRWEKWTKQAILLLIPDEDKKRLHAAEISADALKKALLRPHHHQPNSYYLSSWAIMNSSYESLKDMEQTVYEIKSAGKQTFDSIAFVVAEYSKSIRANNKNSCTDKLYATVWTEVPGIALGHYVWIHTIQWHYFDGSEISIGGYIPPEREIKIIRKDLFSKSVRIKDKFDCPRNRYKTEWREILIGAPRLIEPYNEFMRIWRESRTIPQDLPVV